MAGTLEHYGSGSRISRVESRRYGAGLARLNTKNGLSLAQIDNTVDLQTAKVDGAVQVTRRGMEGAALISQLQNQLGQMVPGCENAVSYVADRGILALGDTVSDTVIRLRRIGRCS